MHIFITGGTGFLGREIIQRLKQESLHFKVAGKNIAELASKDLQQLYDFFLDIDPQLTNKQKAIGKAGHELSGDEALSVVFGYACGLDMTRRDLQIASRESKGPWDIGKDFENAAVIGHIRPVADIGHPDRGRIELRVNGEQRQDSDLANLIWPVPAIIAHLSTYYRLEPGDLIYTGTPDGVGPVRPGDRITGSVEGVGEIELVCRPNEAQGQGR